MKRWWVRLLAYAWPQRGALVLVLLLVLLGLGIGLLRPWPLKLVVDNVLKHEPLPAALEWLAPALAAGSPAGVLAGLALATVGLFLAQRIVHIVQSYVTAGAGSRMTYHLAQDLFDHLQRLSWRFHGVRRTGDLLQRVTEDCACVRQLAIDVLVPALGALGNLCAMLAVVWSLDKSLALVALLVVVPLGLLIKRFSGPMADWKYKEKTLQGALSSHAEQTLTAMPVVQAFGREELEDERFRRLSDETIQANLGATLSSQKFKVGTGLVTTLGSAAILVLGGLRVLDGGLLLGELLVVLFYVKELYGPLETLSYLSADLAAAHSGARRVLEVLDTQHDVRASPTAAPFHGPTGRGVRVELVGVRFGYEPGREVLAGIDLAVAPGETVALVGPTGAGKSTLVSLLPRLFDPWSGRVLLDGTDVRELELASLRAHVSILLQQPFLLPLTLAENIALGRPDASAEEIRAAARASGADAFVARLPLGYATVLGERGVTLSGGEQQRIAIARALLKDAPLVILDEPTAALDAETEAEVMSALEALLRGRTTVMIAHRLSTARRADRILVMEHGRIVESGTHMELLARQGAYAALWNAQAPAQVETGSPS